MYHCAVTPILYQDRVLFRRNLGPAHIQPQSGLPLRQLETIALRREDFKKLRLVGIGVQLRKFVIYKSTIYRPLAPLEIVLPLSSSTAVYESQVRQPQHPAPAHCFKESHAIQTEVLNPFWLTNLVINIDMLHHSC